METAAISYRVADFLKQFPPFNALPEADLVALAAHGRVRFYEPNEFVLWQGEPHKAYVFVIQQGTVSLWDESGEQSELRDVRGAGDLLGIEQFNGARACLHSARSVSDVVLYGFAVEDFDALVLSHPHARQYMAEIDSVTSDFERVDERVDLPRTFLREVSGPLHTCRPRDAVTDAARLLARTGADAVAVVDTESRPVGLLTTHALLAWVAEGGGRSDLAVADLQTGVPPTVAPDASITDSVLAMGAANVDVVAMTTDGTPSGRLLALVSSRDLTRAFGDQPSAILRDIRQAGDLAQLRALNQRARACALQHLTDAAATDWLAPFIELVDHAVLGRILALTGLSDAPGCWCLCGTSGRGESMTRRLPHVVLIHDDETRGWAPQEGYARVLEALDACGYLPGLETPFEPPFHVASTAEWSRRYDAMIRNPVLEQMARSRALFDLRPAHGVRALWERVRDSLAHGIDRDVLWLLAHDCLASLPPLTFYQDAVVESSGAQSAVFRLEHSALQPLIDVGRVFGIATQKVMGTSTRDRFAIARSLLPAHEAIFRDASQALRIVLWQQGRIGISQGTTGAELPPALLSRHDRHMLRSGFPAIQRLIEFTADPSWLDAL